MRAAEIEKASGNPRVKVLISQLHHSAAMYNAAGKYSEAIPFLREALAIKKKSTPNGYLDTAYYILNLATVLRDIDSYNESESLFNEALTIFRKILPEKHIDIASCLDNLAKLYEDTGRYSKADQLYRESLSIRAEILPIGHKDITTSINNLAGLLLKEKRYTEAESLFRIALTNSEKNPQEESTDIATSINNMAMLLMRTGRHVEAESLCRKALAIWKKALPDGHPNIAAGINNLAFLLDITGRYADAEPLYREALVIASHAGIPKSLWKVQGNLSKFYSKQNQRPLAIFFGKQAVNTIQAVRQNLKASEQTTQQTFLTTVESSYTNLADLLIAEGRLPEAQQVLEMLKEYEYFQFLRRDAAADPRQTTSNYNTFEAEQLQIYDQASRTLAQLGVEYRQLQDIEPFERTPEQDTRIQVLDAEFKVEGQQFNAAIESIKVAFTNLTKERIAELSKRHILHNVDDRGLVRSLAPKGQPKVALLHTLVVEDKVHLLLTLPDVLLARQSSVTEVQLNSQIQALRHALQDPHADPRPAGQALYTSLIAPIVAALDGADIKILMVSLDGALRYIPLAALYDGKQYLMERYALTVFTDLTRDKITQPPTPNWKGAGLGVSMEYTGFNPLHYVPAELAAIIQDANIPTSSGVLPGKSFLNTQFTQAILRKSLGYPVVHIASHFSLNPGNETMSFLLLGDGSHLDLGRLRNEGFRFTGVDLITLSACDTALDSPGAKGQEIEGLGTLAQKQGAKGVIATLWPVDDASTGLLMQHLYRLRQEQHLSKAEALRQAQLLMLRGTTTPTATVVPRGQVVRFGPNATNTKAFITDPTKPYAHPYYWAPFILMGNWL